MVGIKGHETWPLPLAARREPIQPACTWSWFLPAFASIVNGGSLRPGLVTSDAYAACVLSSRLPFIYAVAIGIVAKWRRHDAQGITTAVFRRAHDAAHLPARAPRHFWDRCARVAVN